MTTEVTPKDSLKQWWENAELKDKAFYKLEDNGDLCLRASEYHSARIITNLTLENASALLKALEEKFPEVEARVYELEQEWEATPEKLKLLGKTERLRDYLNHTNAIGNFEALFEKISGWEKKLAELEEENFKEKALLVEKAENMAASSESWKETTQALKDFGEQWKTIGFVEKQRNDELWSRLEAARNLFFERKRVFQENQEKEMLQNLDLKMELVEKAESLASSENWKETTETFKELMEQWKSTGRTMHEKNEALWSRFIAAKNNFFERKKIHFESIQAEQEANYLIKLALVEKAEALKESTDWNKTTQAYAAIMDEWKKTGRVPLEKADEVWNRLNAAKEIFFNNKRQFTETRRVEMEDNYARKLALLRRAEALKDSNQWREATDEINELMTEWKSIGPVPREHVNTLWEKFITARKHFFARKDEDRERRKQKSEKQILQKQQKTQGFLIQLQQELNEETEKLSDFNNAIRNITPGNKEEELRVHLQKLIHQCEAKIKHKEQKIKEVTEQIEQIEKKNKIIHQHSESSPLPEASE